MLIKKYQAGIILCLSIITMVVWIFVFAENKPSQILRVIFLDVGQGDAIFIETGDKKQMLIDGGPDLGILEKLGRTMNFYDRYIDIILLTHPEQDHLNGLIEVLKRYDIGAVIMSGIYRDTEQYKEFLEIIMQQNIPVYFAQADGIVDFGNDIGLSILYPFENMANKEISNSNNYSVVSKLSYKNFDVLFTGDIEKSAENKLINVKTDLKADILKIAHHGSKTSSSGNFLKAVDAIMAIIEVGKDNQYGHPHQEVLQRLKNLLVFTTGDKGNITLLSNGEKFWIK
jgi:competence protein ComEC